MANLIPFRGVLYDPAIIKDVAQVVAPPYDVIDAEAQQALHARHPYNVIRLELGLERPGDGPQENRYTRAAALLRDWMRSGALKRDPVPAVYPYTIEYRVPALGADREPRILNGFLSLVEIQEFGAGRIFPHENTQTAAKLDRLRLLETCRANFSPIFSLFSDPEGRVHQLIERAVNDEKPRIEFHDEAGFRHRLWTITAGDSLREIAAAMKSQPLFIADGHHRYETALAYRHLRRQQAGVRISGAVQPYDSVLMLFSSLEDPGLTVLPTHRVLRTPVLALERIKERLGEDFKIEEFPFQTGTEPEARRLFLRTLRSRGRSRHAFGLALQGTDAYVLLTLRSIHRIAAGTSARDRLDVSILHSQVLDRLCKSLTDEEAILYTKEDDEALDLVWGGAAQAALLLNPTKVSEVQAVAASGDRMPPKSTYFFPKPLTGLVMNVLEE